MRLLTVITFLLFSTAAAAQQIVGGAGICHTNGDPNTAITPAGDARYNCRLAIDTTSGTPYWLDETGTWVAVDTSQTNELDNETAVLPSYSKLETYTGEEETAIITDDLMGGLFRRDPSATVVDGGVVVAAGWRRIFEGNVKAIWFGVNPNDQDDDSSAFEAASATAVQLGVPVELPASGEVVLENVSIGADIISKGCEIVPRDNVYDYLITFSGESMSGVRVNQRRYLDGSGRKTAIRANGGKDLLITDFIGLGVLGYDGNTSYMVDALRPANMIFENFRTDSTDYGSIRVQTSHKKSTFNNVTFDNPRRNSISTIGRPTSLTRSSAAGSSVVYAPIPAETGMIFAINFLSGTEESGKVLTSTLTANGDYEVTLDTPLSGPVSEGDQYVSPMGSMFLNNVSVNRVVNGFFEGTSGGSILIDPTNSILRDVFINNLQMVVSAENSCMKLDYVQNAKISNSTIHIRNPLNHDLSSGTRYALSLVDIAEVGLASRPKLQISNSTFGGIILNGGFDIYADNSIFDLSHLPGVSADYNVSIANNRTFIANGCIFKGADRFVFIQGSPGNLPDRWEVNNCEFSTANSGGSLIGNGLASAITINNLSNPDSRLIAPTVGENESLSISGKSIDPSRTTGTGTGRVYRNDNSPELTTGMQAVAGDVSINTGWTGAITSPRGWLCTTSGNPGTWEPFYHDNFDDLRVGNILNVKEIIIDGAGRLRRNPSGGGLMIQPAFNAANQFGVSFHNFSGTEIAVFDDGANANFKRAAEFNGGLSVLGGSLNFGQRRSFNLPAPIDDSGAARRIDVDNALASANSYTDNAVSNSAAEWSENPATQDVDAANFKIGNLAAPSAPTDAARLQDITSAVGEHGSTSGTPDANGNLTFTHTIGTVPATVVLTAKGETYRHLQYLPGSSNGTTGTVRVMDTNGAPITTGTVEFSWIAYK